MSLFLSFIFFFHSDLSHPNLSLVHYSCFSSLPPLPSSCFNPYLNSVQFLLPSTFSHPHYNLLCSVFFYLRSYYFCFSLFIIICYMFSGLPVHVMHSTGLCFLDLTVVCLSISCLISRMHMCYFVNSFKGVSYTICMYIMYL